MIPLVGSWASKKAMYTRTEKKTTPTIKLNQ